MLYIFDKDGTICHSKSGQKFIHSIDDQILIPGVKEKCEFLREQSHSLTVCSNQGGVAFGFMSYEDAHVIITHAARLIRAHYYIFCPHHPDGTNKYGWECTCRKPSPEMLFMTMESFDYSPKDTIFIGDMLTDKQAADAANIKFEWAKDFFNIEEKRL